MPNNKCPVCGKFFIFNEKKVNTDSGNTVHEKCLSGAISSPCINNEVVKSKLEMEHKNVTEVEKPAFKQPLKEGLLRSLTYELAPAF